MKLIKKIKDWRDRRFQKRVFKALGAYETDTAIILKKNLVSRRDVQSFGTSASASIPAQHIDEIHNSENGHPV